MFYSGYKSLHSLLKVKLIRDRTNPHDNNAVMLVAAGRQLDYIEIRTAFHVAPVMDEYEGMSVARYL